MAVNSTGVYLGPRNCLTGMVSRSYGSIINISSVFGWWGTKPRRLPRREIIAHRSDPECCDGGGSIQRPGQRRGPGPVITEMALQDYMEVPGTIANSFRSHCFGRTAQPEELAGAVLFLASDESSHVTGTELIVYGGLPAGFQSWSDRINRDRRHPRRPRGDRHGCGTRNLARPWRSIFSIEVRP